MKDLQVEEPKTRYPESLSSLLRSTSGLQQFNEPSDKAWKEEKKEQY